MNHFSRNILASFCIPFLLPALASAQTAQVAAEARAAGDAKVRVDYVHYRPAKWDATHIKEAESDITNQGGLLYFYLTNVSDAPVHPRFWRYNNRDESFWLLNHLVAWHRLLKGTLAPGETTVLEINAISRDFGKELPFVFQLVDDTWAPCLRYDGVLAEDTVQVSFIRVRPGLRELEVHVRNAGKDEVTLTGVEVLGHKVAEVQWRGQALPGGRNAIGRVRLEQAASPSELLIVKVGMRDGKGERPVFAHRRAFEDTFPIGTWGIDAKDRAFLANDHVDTGVLGGKRDDEFFGRDAERFGLHAMVHTGEPVNVDMVRDLSGHPAVTCWMLRDEPDWSIDPQIVLFCDETVRANDKTKPTYVNLCRNIKFMEYAPIADIACQDHYSVTAPSSSIWPFEYGTYLEETAYYTKDLKYAAEPKPVWVWTQGNHDGWSERMRRPVPTPEELSAQLVLNLGRGAKGVIWFTYNPKNCQKYPETRESMRGWNRVLNVLREDILGSEPAELAPQAPERVDVAALATWDKLILCVTNLDYKIHPKAYPFETRHNLKISVELPAWIKPEAAVRVAGEGISPIPCKRSGNGATVTLDKLVDGAVIVLSNEQNAEKAYAESYRSLLKKEAQ